MVLFLPPRPRVPSLPILQMGLVNYYRWVATYENVLGFGLKRTFVVIEGRFGTQWALEDQHPPQERSMPTEQAS